MVVLTLAKCPPGLRGDVTKWLLEIAPGVFVGRVNARVREKLWARVLENAKDGRAVMVYNTNNEQRLDFKVFGEAWEPIDFDGIKLMLRPSTPNLRQTGDSLTHGFSDAAKRRTVKKIAAARERMPVDYVVLDLETTGLDPEKDEILAIGALKATSHQTEDTFYALIQTERRIPPAIEAMTGISALVLEEKGESLSDVLPRLLAFIATLPVIAHNAEFDRSFLRYACAKCGLQLFSNRFVDTLATAKRMVSEVTDYKLPTLAAYFNLPPGTPHRPLEDCETTHRLYLELNKLMKN